MGPPFEFINASAGSKQERRRNSHLARAHAAKINRQKKALMDRERSLANRPSPSLGRQGSNSSHGSYSRESSDVPDVDVSPETIQESAGPSSNDDVERNQDVKFGHQSSPDIDEYSPSHTDSEKFPTRKRKSTTPTQQPSIPTPGSTPSSTIEEAPANARPEPSELQHYIAHPSRSLRTINVDVVEFEGPSTTGWMYDYLMNVLLPPRMSNNQAGLAAWSTAFCQDPLVFHASHWASAKHRDLLANEERWTKSREVLVHKTKALSLLRRHMAAIEEASDAIVEWIILAVLCFARAELQQKDIHDDFELPFIPHVPAANWMALYGRTELVDVHREALCQLLYRQGGYKCLQTPGMALLIALIDLGAASTTYEQPRLPRYWDVDLSALSFSWLPRLPVTCSAGQGFVFQVPGGLPPQAKNIFMSLAIVDQLLSQVRQQWMSDANFQTLLDVRNATHYDLLSLSSWDKFDAADKDSFPSTVYEVCRLTCTLYSNATIIGLPPHNGWHTKLVSGLRMLLHLSRFESWPDDGLALLTWCVMVGGIAAYRSRDREFFEEALRIVLSRRCITSWSVVRRGLQDFLWSDHACEHGAAVMWDTSRLSDE